MTAPARRNIRLVIATAGLVLLSAGAMDRAYAYWSAPGSGIGAGSAATTNLAGVGLVPIAVGTDLNATTLLPGGTADAIIKVANPNAYPVTVTSVAQTSGQAIAAANGCSPTGVSFASQTGTWSVPANTTGTVIHLTGAVSMSTAAANACQGTTFTIPVTVTVQK